MAKKEAKPFGYEEYTEIRNSLIAKGKANEALEKFDEVLLSEKDNPYALHGKAYSLDELGRQDEALKLYQSAVEIHPEVQLLWHGKGVILANMGLYHQALADYNMALEADPDFFHSWLAKGNALSNLGQNEEALAAFNRAIAIKPDFKKVWNNKGNILKRLGRNEEALEAFDEAIKLDEKAAFPWNGKGIALKNLSRYEEALAAYDKAIEIDSGLASAYFNRGILYEKINRNSEALADFKHLLTLERASGFQKERTQKRIEELEKRMASQDLDQISRLVDQIEELLKFDGKHISHYTSLSVAKFLLFGDKPSPLRATEAAYMNDPSEGTALFEFLDKETKLGLKKDGVQLPFVKKPFMACFVPEDKYDDLNLWRFYGKEGSEDACGCSITLDYNRFSDALNASIEKKLDTGRFSDSLDASIEEKGEIDKPNTEKSQESWFQFYQVAYFTANGTHFSLPQNVANESELNHLMADLKATVSKVMQKPEAAADHLFAREQLARIMFLFKNDHYHSEKEVRIILSGPGYAKLFDQLGMLKIDTNFTPPKVYLELVPVMDSISRVTIGPKANRPEEWEASFHYSFERQGKEVRVTRSNLPYK